MNKDTSIQTRYVIYTDGGCMFNPGGPGGYGTIIVDTKTGTCQEFTDAFTSTTNNRMEVSAILRGLEETATVDEPITIVSDSQYAINCATGAWRRNKNGDLWERYEKLAKGRKLSFIWVHGHNGNEYNEKCDALATLAMQSKHYKEDAGYETEKKAGREFYERLEEHERSFKDRAGGAMSITIRISDDLEHKPPFLSNNEYARKYNVHTQCASAINTFYLNKKYNFKAYAALKTGGMDFWSRKTKEDIVEEIGKDAWLEITKYLTDGKDQLKCGKWVCRGLRISDAIRKVLVDAEISENCIR